MTLPSLLPDDPPGAWVRRRREALGLSRRELGLALGLPPHRAGDTVRDIERGRITGTDEALILWAWATSTRMREPVAEPPDPERVWRVWLGPGEQSGLVRWDAVCGARRAA